MRLNIDISWQISQLYNTGKNNKNKGSALAIVSDDRMYKVDVYLTKEECRKIVDYFIENGCKKKTAFLTTHCFMIKSALLVFDKEVKEKILAIKICRDFASHLMTPILRKLIPDISKYKLKWNGGKKDKSSADKYANYIRKNPKEANCFLTLKGIKSMETPLRKGK